ncbi:putative ankyrin 2,3/unc44 [Metarhizium acridum CQMa 102]|uniref:Putative ankyrin 2,3/unc44 n=1 Tax=Metarhizium acridum (strain CQMa 102) TaxID=655827 RepID=E9E8J4_METAQ|nr:putative ankyrin 2,3/unc44 [Metarhizium acridum CQMa 102]EFY87825.1 putative ankyrin 2,3/unc44 [Metarhizium acridum CQMa 102]
MHKNGVQSRGLALVEAARKGKLSTLRLILGSYPSDLDFDHGYLHSAFKVAASSGNLDLFQELEKPREEHTTTQQAEQSSSSKDYANNVLEDEELKNQEASILLERNDPLLRLAFPLCRASSLGMEDIVAKLLALGRILLVDGGASLAAKTKLGETPLDIAAAFGAQDIDNSGLTPLQSACERGHFLAADPILKHRKMQEYLPPEADDQWKCPPLFVAASDDYLEATRYLISRMPDVNTRDGHGQPPLWIAALGSHTETVRVLAEANGDVNDVCGDEEWLPLQAAYQHRATIRALVGLGADTNRETGKKGTPLWYAILLGRVENCKLLLNEAKDKPDLTRQSIQDAMLDAVIDGFKDTVSLMLEAGVDVNTVNEHDRTLISLVVAAGCKVDGINKSKFTPLMVAIVRGNDEVVKYLLTKNAVTATLSYHGGIGNTFACCLPTSLRDEREDDADKEEIFKLLLERGADPTLRGRFSSYPIITASLDCKSGIIQSLLDHKISIDVQDACGKKPAHVACCNSLEVLNLLQVPDSDFAVKDAIGRVPLHYAVLSRQVDLVKEVLVRSVRVGVDVNVGDKDGWTPLLWGRVLRTS